MARGVSAMKEDVHNAIKNIDKGLFPQAFCKIIPDILVEIKGDEIFYEAIQTTVTSCTLMVLVPNRLWLICIGKKLAM